MKTSLIDVLVIGMPAGDWSTPGAIILDCLAGKVAYIYSRFPLFNSYWKLYQYLPYYNLFAEGIAAKPCDEGTGN